MATLAALGLTQTAAANTSNGYNLPIGVTGLSQAMYGLHMEVFWICVGIAVVVFGIMIYSLVTFRQSVVRSSQALAESLPLRDQAIVP